MKKILIATISTTIIFTALLVGFITTLSLNSVKVADLLAALTSVFATIAFGFWITYLFKKEEEKKNELLDKTFCDEIRKKEFSKITFLLNSLVRSFYEREDQLLAKIDVLKCSFTINSIDFKNLTTNYFVFDYIYKHIEEYFTDEDDIFLVKTNIDVLYFRDQIGTKWIDNKEHKIPEIYGDFTLFCDECFNLSTRMQDLNLQYKKKIFSKDEIECVSYFKSNYTLGIFRTVYPPFAILDVIKHLLPFVSFLNVDFLPAYKHENFWNDFEKVEKVTKEFPNKMEKWKKENEALSMEVIAKLKKIKNDN